MTDDWRRVYKSDVAHPYCVLDGPPYRPRRLKKSPERNVCEALDMKRSWRVLLRLHRVGA